MLNPEQLSQYLEGRIPELERPAFEARLAQDAEAQALLAEQQRMHFALAAVLAGGEDHQRIKHSIFTVLRAAPEAQLAAEVMHTARASRPRAAKSLPRTRLQELIRAWEKLIKSGAWQTAAVAICLVALVVISGVLWNRSLVPGSTGSIVLGQVTTVIGEPVWVGRSQTAAPLTTRQMIRTGDRLETGDAERLEIRFNDGTTLQLHFNTIVQIPPAADLNAAPALDRPPEIQLIQGQVWTVVQKSTNGTPYAIRTDAATALALGTEFGVKVDRPLQFQSTATGNGGWANATVLTVKEGTVEFFNAFGSVEATAMTESTARLGSAPTEPKRLQTLQARHGPAGESWSIQTAPLKPMEAARKLAGGGWFSGLRLRNVPNFSAVPGGATHEVRVGGVEEASPASQAGIVAGDLIEAINGEPVLSAARAEQLLLTWDSATLRLRRQEELEIRQFISTRTAPGLPGPDLAPADQAALSSLLQSWAMRGEAGAISEQRFQEEAAGVARVPRVRAAAFNDLGVFLELEDRLGPAVRAYGRAVYLHPESALYRFNLGLALRKIGSYERACEELQAALSLVPDSSLLQTRVAEMEALLGAPAEALARVEGALEKDPRSHNLWELKAQLLWRAGNLEEARTAAWQAVRYDPDCAVGHAYLGGVLRELGRLEEAEVALQSALEIDPFHAGLHVELGMVQEARGALGAAVEAFERAIALQPDFARAQGALGSLLARQGEAASAVQALEKAVELEPGEVNHHLELGWTRLKQGDLARAEDAFRKAIQVAGQDPHAQRGLGAALRRQGRMPEAKAHLIAAISLKPDEAASYSGLGILFQELGQMKEAEEQFRKALELDPNDPPACINLAAILRERPAQLAEAEKLYRKAIQLLPEFAGAFSGLADVLARTGRAAEAEPMARRAYALEPNSAPICNNLGEILRHRGKAGEAETLYRRALQLDPNLPSAMNNLGILHIERKQFGQAEEIYRELLRQRADAPRQSMLPVLVNLAIACGEQGKLEEAERLFREALALAPAEPRIFIPLADFLAGIRRELDEALRLAESAVTALPGNAQALNTLGFVHLQRGELDLAERTLNRAMAVASDEPARKEIRDRLQQVKAAQRSPNR
jgi:tetratricopeptide (TPR) repeat protein